MQIPKKQTGTKQNKKKWRCAIQKDAQVVLLRISFLTIKPPSWSVAPERWLALRKPALGAWRSAGAGGIWRSAFALGARLLRLSLAFCFCGEKRRALFCFDFQFTHYLNTFVCTDQ